jgi:nicotinate-nucleotide adenylyltransferase
MTRGLLGGTFDPIHMGHLIAAETARSALQLDEVWFVPTGVPWMKRGQPISEGRHRKAMVELAVAANPHFEVLSLELERPGETYTVDTLEAVSKWKGPGNEMVFILGTDAFRGLTRWRNPARILELAMVAVVSRSGYAAPEVRELEQAVPGASRRIVQVTMPLIEISGADIRQRAAHGLSIRYLVPDPVADYIKGQGLYRAATAVRARAGRRRAP